MEKNEEKTDVCALLAFMRFAYGGVQVISLL